MITCSCYYFLVCPFYCVYLYINSLPIHMKKLLFAFLALAMLASCGKKDEEENDPEDKMEAANVAAYKTIIDIYNTKQFDKMDAYTAQDFIDHSAAPGQKPGLAGYKEHMQTF